jgi:hypothetical protein
MNRAASSFLRLGMVGTLRRGVPVRVQRTESRFMRKSRILRCAAERAADSVPMHRDPCQVMVRPTHTGFDDAT